MLGEERVLFRLVIEIDGGIHERQREADQARSQQFGEYGYQVIRFRNSEVEDDIEGVLKSIWDFCQDTDKTPLPLSAKG